MRLRSILSEAMRNVGAGNAHALALFVAVLLGGMLLGGYEAYTVGRWSMRPWHAWRP